MIVLYQMKYLDKYTTAQYIMYSQLAFVTTEIRQDLY